jgi:hypothetical protein
MARVAATTSQNVPLHIAHHAIGSANFGMRASAGIGMVE